MDTNPPPRRITIIPFIHGRRTSDGKVSEPAIYFILEKWLERHPEFRERAKEFRISRGAMHLPDGMETELVRMTADFSDDLAEYDPNQDADLYDYFLAEDAGNRTPLRLHKIWIEQCEAARGIEDEFGTDRALSYLVGEKFINFLEAAETDADFRAEIPEFVAEIKQIFERWQLAEYLEIARQTEPFDPDVYDSEEAEMERRHELRKSAGELLLVERAREWLLEE